ncbi:unnamed protein product, partial [Sphagnum compactum]
MEKLIVVSNRLPVTLSRDGDETWKFHMSSGGLVAALDGLKQSHSFVWIGWPGLEIPVSEQAEVSARLFKEYACIPVFLPESIMDLFYNIFSNSILWPLFHYLPGDMAFREDAWNAYIQANTLFAETLTQHCEPGCLIWVHDYQLMLLPKLFRQLSPCTSITIGFFLHTPFPSSEIYRVLPVGKEILDGVLSSDLIGFHTFDYARHFLASCTRILGLITFPASIDVDGRKVTVGTFPIGIEPTKFTKAVQQEHVQVKINDIKTKFKGMKIIVGVDRLDYIKGVPLKLHAMKRFLIDHPEFQQSVVLIQIAVPTREDVDQYKSLISSCNQLVGHINAKFGSLQSMPIHFINKSVNFDDLVALYAVADVCVVTSTRDGMNLVSYEYISSQQVNHGVLILSEFAGAAQSLNGAIIVNPWNIQELANAFHQALTIPPDIRASNHAKLFRYVSKHTSAYWGSQFISELHRI